MSSVIHIIYYSRNEAHQDQDTSFLTGSDSASDFIDLTQKFWNTEFIMKLKTFFVFCVYVCGTIQVSNLNGHNKEFLNLLSKR